jgi:hypothetical protein
VSTCSDAAAAAEEQLIGTASQAEHWLLLEVRAGWGRDAVGDTQLPDDVRVRLNDWLETTPRSRVLFIRKPERRDGTPLTIFLAHVAEHGGGLRREEVERHEDLLELDLDTRGHDRSAPVPLWLVCTHGRRDACCARLGTPVYEALRDRVPANALWQSSHQGGHRFAANVLVLPHGVQLGRVRPIDAERVVAELSKSVLPLLFYRGRTIHSPAVQAADLAVREKLGAVHLTAIRYVGPTLDGERHGFMTRIGELKVAVEERKGPSRPESCGAEPLPTTVYSVRWD